MTVLFLFSFPLICVCQYQSLVYLYNSQLIFKQYTHLFPTELPSSWESLLHWSENESFVKQSQEEMAALIDKLNKVGTSEANLDTEAAIQFAIQEAKVNYIWISICNLTKLIKRSKEGIAFYRIRKKKIHHINFNSNRTSIRDAGSVKPNRNWCIFLYRQHNFSCRRCCIYIIDIPTVKWSP